MAETVVVRHSTFTSAVNHMNGSPMAEVDREDTTDLRSVLNDADSEIDREAGGFFVHSIGDIVSFGFLTPRRGDDVRSGEFFYDVFECPLEVVDGVDIVALRNKLEFERVYRSDAKFESKQEFDRAELAVDPESAMGSWKTVARVWDQFRRDDASAAVHFDDLAGFVARIDGAFGEFSYVEPNEAVNTTNKFDFHDGDPPEFDPDRQGYLLEFLENLDAEKDGRLHVDDLLGLAEERRRRLTSDINKRLETLRTKADYQEIIRERWMAHFDEHVADLIEAHVEAYIELQEKKLDPEEEVEAPADGLFAGSLFSEPTDNMEARLERETANIADEIRAQTVRLADDIEKRMRQKQQQMLETSDNQVSDLKSSELYERFVDE